LNLGSSLLSSKFFYHQIYVITIILYLVLCKINYIWHNTYSNSNVFSKNQNPKFNLMNFYFGFLNFHVSYLVQLGMIYIILKCQKNICKKVHNFHHYPTLFLALLYSWQFYVIKLATPIYPFKTPFANYSVNWVFVGFCEISRVCGM
jgi:hypothetical protein